MDQDTMDFLQHLVDSLRREIAGVSTGLVTVNETVRALYERLGRVEAGYTELRSSMLAYSSHVEMLLNSFAASQRGADLRITAISGELEDIKRRVSALEERLPPRQAA